MNTLQLQNESASTLIEQINAKLRGKLTKIDGEYNLKLDNDFGVGTISYTSLKNGISYLEYDIMFYENFQMVHRSVQDYPIYFIYASKDPLQHSFDTDGTIRKIGKFQTAILRSTKESDDVFHFIKGNSYKIAMIIVSTKCGRIKQDGNNVLFSKISQLFKSEDVHKNFAYFGSYNLIIAEKIKQLKAVSYDGVVRTLLKDALVNMILALEIQQHADDLKNIFCDTGSLTKREMEMIKNLSEFVKDYPEREYTIKSLCTRSGLSSAKLQEGFRIMYGQTVAHYIRHIRILAAEHLIKTTDLNISEVVYSIGLTSRSYFSKIFKKKYNCSPKAYQEHQV